MKHGWYIYTQQLGGGTVRLAGRSTGWRRGTRLANTDFLDTRHSTPPQVEVNETEKRKTVRITWNEYLAVNNANNVNKCK